MGSFLFIYYLYVILKKGGLYYMINIEEELNQVKDADDNLFPEWLLTSKGAEMIECGISFENCNERFE